MVKTILFEVYQLMSSKEGNYQDSNGVIERILSLCCGESIRERYTKVIINNLKVESGQPKNILRTDQDNLGLPKGSNPYGNGGLILGRWARMLASTKVTQFSRSFMVCAGNGETLEMKLEITDGKVTNLYKLICRKELLIKARENLRGSMQSKDGLTDGLNHLLIEEIIQELESEKFKFSDVKLVYKAKANGKTRPQGIPTAKDKIIQEAMRILLEVIYEGKFSDLSHGFRPGRSCHTALKQVSK